MNTQTIERTTLSNLVSNENYCRKVLPFIKADYFDVKEERIKAIEWGLKVIQVEELTEVSFCLHCIRDELVEIRRAIYDTSET